MPDLRAFTGKWYRYARTQGLSAALRGAGGEAGLWALYQLNRPFDRRRAIWADEWDVCLVLDSCRADLYAEVAAEYEWLPDRVSVERSVGSASPEWISETFAPEYHDDMRQTGYVTANPFSGKSGDELDIMNSEVYPLADAPLAYLDEVWRDQWPASPELPTVAPETVTERALWAWANRDRWGIDRLLVHYMQPHIPFRSRPEWCEGWDLDGFGTGGGHGKNDWHMVRDGELDADEFWAAYRDNLRWVLGEVERWRELTDASILVTSDHGNGMGEWGIWGHPPRNAAPALRKVPWVRLEGLGETEVAPAPEGDPPVTAGAESGDRDVDAQLEALGYK